MSKRVRSTIDTTWDVYTYDVWGNRKDGFEVNDSFSRGEISLKLKPVKNNVGTWLEFTSAAPTDRQLQRVFNTKAKLRVDGDDTIVYVNRESDDYPLGELVCTNHSSLSPIRPIIDKNNEFLQAVFARRNAHE